MNRQRLILFILVILFGIALLWSYSAMPRPKTVSTLTFKPGQQGKQPIKVAKAEKQPAKVDDGSILNIGLLDREHIGFKGYRRNIFKPVFANELKMFKQQATAIKQSSSVAKPNPSNVVTPPTQAVIIQPETAPLAHFTFLGFLKKGAVRTIFLAKDKDILLVKKGDKIAVRYEATEISDQALTLSVTDTGEEIVIPLIENKPLEATK